MRVRSRALTRSEVLLASDGERPYRHKGSINARLRSNLAARQPPRVWPESAHRRHLTSNGAGYAFNLSDTALANAENGQDRERPEHQRAGGFLSPGTAPRSLPVLYSDRSTRRTNRGRETMRDDPWTAANRDKEQLKVPISPRRKPTAETPPAPTKPTISGPFWTRKKSAPDLPKPQGVVDARQRTDD